jgi:hypothetical protein
MCWHGRMAYTQIQSASCNSASFEYNAPFKKAGKSAQIPSSSPATYYLRPEWRARSVAAIANCACPDAYIILPWQRPIITNTLPGPSLHTSTLNPPTSCRLPLSCISKLLLELRPFEAPVASKEAYSLLRLDITHLLAFRARQPHSSDPPHGRRVAVLNRHARSLHPNAVARAHDVQDELFRCGAALLACD